MDANKMKDIIEVLKEASDIILDLEWAVDIDTGLDRTKEQLVIERDLPEVFFKMRQIIRRYDNQEEDNHDRNKR